MKLYNDDCLNVFKKLKDKSIDLIFTSPPFKDDDVNGDYWEIYDQWIQEMLRIGRVVCIIHSTTKLNEHVRRYPHKRMLIWGKGVVKYSWRFNPIYIYESSGYKVNKYIWSDVFGVAPLFGSKKSHKYQDPLILYKTIIEMISRGGLKKVLDPFMGSGTTGQACKILGMDFIGIEVDRINFGIAKKNIKEQKKESIYETNTT